jgi:putative FmdB family regulatory protein
MPVYEYQCQKCGDRLEELRKFSDRPLKKHNGCGGRLKRLLSAPAFHFKGSGWYVTDYARRGSSDSAGDHKDGAEKKTESKTEKAAAKTESKPAEKTTKS